MVAEGTERVTCPRCREAFAFGDLTVKSDAWLIRRYDAETKTFVPTSVTAFDYFVMECPLCGDEFDDSDVEDMIEWGSAATVEVL